MKSLMSRPDINALEIAVAVIESGSMSTAAVQLGMTQSAVSQAIKRVEAQLEVKLIHRNKRPLMPTEAGRLLALRMQDIITRTKRSIEEVRATGLIPERQALRLSMVDTFASTAGPLLINDLMESGIASRVSAFSGLAHAHTESLMRNETDAVITSDSKEEVESLMRIPILREPFVLVAPAEWESQLLNRSLKDILCEYSLIRYSARSHMGKQIERHLRRLRVEHPQHLSFDTSDSLLAMVAGGVGVAISTPLCLLQGAAQLPALAVLPLPSPSFFRELTLVTRLGESDILGPRIAEAARSILNSHTIPKIVSCVPWLKEKANKMILP